MNSDSVHRPLLVLGNRNRRDVTSDISGGMTASANRKWLIAFTFSCILVLGGGYFVYRTWWDGVGMWGENKTINWAWDITNFVWWIGIGHAGTLISAILLLFRAEWRNSINRSAEAMTICAVICAAFFILAHVGRPWVAYWIFPFPDKTELWVNFNSPLVWDAFAILTYFTVSLLYWYLGMLPDFAEMREKNTGIKRYIYNTLSLNWDSSAWTWRRYESTMLVIAGLATALVISVHSIVSMDFACGIVPGWHSTIFPPYFVVGAILSGLAMVLNLLIPMRSILELENYITIHHIENLNKLLLSMSGLIGIAYFSEIFMAFYSVNDFEKAMMIYRMKGDYFIYFIIMISCNVFLPQLLWFRSLRRNVPFSFILAIFVNVGMWVERFVIIVTSLSHDFLPTSWALFYPTIYDIGVFIFSIGFFLFMFLLFIKFLPVINMSEVKSTIKT